MNIIIAPMHLHMDLQSELLASLHQETLVGYSIIDFTTFIKNYAEENYLEKLNALFEIHEALKDKESSLFKNLLHSTGFQKELLRIMNELKSNGIKVNELPETTNTQRELKQVLSYIETINYSSNIYHSAYTKIKNVEDFSNVSIINFYPSNYYEREIINHMISHGAKQEIRTLTPTSIEYYCALNQRTEVEIVAREIVDLVLSSAVSLDKIQILIPDSSYNAFIGQVFGRYNIPYYNANEVIHTNAENALRSLLTFLGSKRLEDLKAFLYSPLISIPHANELISYMEAFELAYDDIFVEFEKVSLIDFDKEVFNNFRKKDLEYLEEGAKEAQSVLVPMIENLLSDNLYTFVMHIYNLFIGNERLEENDTKYLNSFRSHMIPLKNALSSLRIEDGLDYLEDELDSLQIKSKRLSNVVRISNYADSYLNTDHTFVLGACQSTYPAFSTLSGIFDEALVESLTNYPTLDERYTTTLTKLKNSFSVAKHLHISFAQSDFAGKTRESSLELELAFHLDSKNLRLIEPEENDTYEYPEHSLRPDLARSILIKDQKVYGSISSIEVFFQCPYRYFLKSGLHVPELRKLSVDESAFGSLQHKLLEDSVNLHGKDYVNIAEEELDAFLDDEFAAYEKLYPTKSHAITLMKSITKKNMLKSIASLKDMENHTRFIPKKAEYEFDKDYLEHDGITLHLKGYIDRYDTNFNGFRIIDYKSSDHSFSKPKFHSGQLLQLMTYATIVAELESTKIPYGIYYWSFANKTVNDEPYARIPRDFELVDNVTEPAVPLLDGYTFSEQLMDYSTLDDDVDKPHVKKTQKAQNFVELQSDLQKIYEYFIEKLEAGTITCAPTEGACTYCHYGRICNFKGKLAKVQSLPIFEDEKEDEGNA